MNRRNFLGNLCKTAILATIAPTVLTSDLSTKLEVLTVTDKANEVMLVNINGNEYWYYREQMEAFQKWQEEREVVYWKQFKGFGIYE